MLKQTDRLDNVIVWAESQQRLRRKEPMGRVIAETLRHVRHVYDRELPAGWVEEVTRAIEMGYGTP